MNRFQKKTRTIKQRKAKKRKQLRQRTRRNKIAKMIRKKNRMQRRGKLIKTRMTQMIRRAFSRKEEILVRMETFIMAAC